MWEHLRFLQFLSFLYGKQRPTRKWLSLNCNGKSSCSKHMRNDYTLKSWRDLFKSDCRNNMYQFVLLSKEALIYCTTLQKKNTNNYSKSSLASSSRDLGNVYILSSVFRIKQHGDPITWIYFTPTCETQSVYLVQHFVIQQSSSCTLLPRYLQAFPTSAICPLHQILLCTQFGKPACTKAQHV